LLSPRKVEHLIETRRRAAPENLFTDEGLAGVELNQIDAAIARRAALAFGRALLPPEQLSAERSTPPEVVLASDGRPVTSELTEAVAEGLRGAGCNVVEVGAATSPVVASAIGALSAAGGILVGNPLNRQRTLGLKFWSAGGRPLSAEWGLDELQIRFDAGPQRNRATSASVRRHLAAGGYLEELRTGFHALRPLRIELDCRSGPWRRLLGALTGEVACQFLSPELGGDRDVDLSVTIDDDGEICRVADERGQMISGDALLATLVESLGQGERTIVVEDATSPASRRRLEASGARVVCSDARRAAMDDAMRRHAAALAGGPSGRFWYGAPPLADALRTVSLLLMLLSTSDRPLSQVAAGDIVAR
jgi:phosphomannomutase